MNLLVKKIEITDFQKSLWNEYLINKLSSSINIVMPFILDGKVDINKMNNGFNYLVKYLEPSRIYFTETEGKIYQNILEYECVKEKYPDYKLLYKDFYKKCKDENLGYEKILIKFRKIISKEYDLTSYPLVKHHLFRFGKEKYLFFILIPHIIR